MNKFGARKSKCMAKQHPHPSALEAAVCDLLTAREQAGEIRDVKWQATVHLTKRIRWKVDWTYTECATGTQVWCEAKGRPTRDYVVKRNLWADGFGPGPLHIWEGTWRRPVLARTILPEERGTE